MKESKRDALRMSFSIHLPTKPRHRFRFRRAKRFRLLDEQVSTGEIYLYRVVAYTIDGYESPPSEPAQIQRQPPPDSTATPAP